MILNLSLPDNIVLVQILCFDPGENLADYRPSITKINGVTEQMSEYRINVQDKIFKWNDIIYVRITYYGSPNYYSYYACRSEYDVEEVRGETAQEIERLLKDARPTFKLYADLRNRE